MSNDVVLYHAENGVATVTLNRPDQRNAINPEVCDAMRDAFDRIDTDPDVQGWISRLLLAVPVTRFYLANTALAYSLIAPAPNP